jgi:hypothetical protein
VDLVVIFTILRWEILTAGLHREQLLKIFRMTGPAQYAASAKICLRNYNDDGLSDGGADNIQKIAIVHKNTLFTGCPVKRVHIKIRTGLLLSMKKS